MSDKSRHFSSLEGQLSFDSGEVRELYLTWLTFLTAAGNYTKRFYLLQDLEQPEHNPESDSVLQRYYGDIRTLKLVMQQDIERLEGHILNIYRQQKALGLGGFKLDAENFTRFIEAFSMISQWAQARRNFYRAKIHREARKPTPRAFSLHELEEAFRASKSYRAACANALDSPDSTSDTPSQ